MPIIRGKHPGGVYIHWTYIEPAGGDYLLNLELVTINEYDGSILELKASGWAKEEVELLLGCVEMWGKRKG